MKLYHTGFTIIDKPDVHYGRANADFGQGFYVTDDYEFACRWAKERRDMIPIVNEYECDFTGLKVHEFERTHEWFNYIFKNRRFKPDDFAKYREIVRREEEAYLKEIGEEMEKCTKNEDRKKYDPKTGTGFWGFNKE